MFDIDQLSEEWEARPFDDGARAPFRHIALIGNALPRKCGLATFTSHVADALAGRYPSMRVDHYAMDDSTGIEYPAEIATIRADDPAAYRDAAIRIEDSGAEAIWLQHEYGIFGGKAGSHIFELLEATNLPLIVTLHTVLDHPGDEEDVVLRRLARRAQRLIVMASKGADILRRHYGIDPHRIVVSPHGVPDLPFRSPDELKPGFGWEGRRVLMTFGLLAPDKGIRHMIEAMPAIVEAHPDALYAIVGATHPNLVHHEGEAHREMLAQLAADLGVADHIRFIDAFVEQEELLRMLQACDLYVTPYLNMEQVTSGTLSYAVAAGKPIIATPYLHALELLADGHGVLVPPSDAAALAKAALELLSDDARRERIARAAYSRGRTMLWPKVVEQALAPLGEEPNRRRVSRLLRGTGALPLDAIVRMSDEVGILQHALFNVPDRDHGYCIDDNARALMVMVRRDGDPQAERLAATYASFIRHGWNAQLGRFRNFMDYGRRWLEESGSDDSNGRTVWALGVTAARATSPSMRDWARHAFESIVPQLKAIESPRAMAFAALGGHAMLARWPGNKLAESLLERAGERLIQLHRSASREDWNWFEPELAYDNARLPEVLMRAGQALGRPDMTDLGLSTMRWLVDRQTGPRGTFRPVGCNGFGRRYSPPLAFDQQPVEAVATIDAAAAAFEVTGLAEWHDVARHAFGWFFGDNDAGVPLADPADGSCFDGLMATGVNRNQGAESILSLQLAALTMQEAFNPLKQAGQKKERAAEAGILAAPEGHDSLTPSPAET